MRLILQAFPTAPAPAPLHGHKVDLEGPAGALIYCVCAWVCVLSMCEWVHNKTVAHFMAFKFKFTYLRSV